MAKFFVVSDIHGYYDIFIKALQNSGYDTNNPDHYLINLGDLFDRGRQPTEVLNFFNNSPKDKTILIKGNHEDLLKEAVKRQSFQMYDYYNFTEETVRLLVNPKQKYLTETQEAGYLVAAWDKIEPLYNRMLNYFETEHYIFVHAWIPVLVKDNKPKYYTKDRILEYDPNWRDALPMDWNIARWGNPFENANNSLNKTNKTIVFGHWHTSWIRNKEGICSEFGKDAVFDVFEDKEKQIIGIDACTAHTQKVNVLVLEDNFI